MPHFVICPRNQIIFETVVLYGLMRLPDRSQILGMGLFTLAFLGIARSHPRALPIERDVWFESKRLSEIRREHDDV